MSVIVIRSARNNSVFAIDGIMKFDIELVGKVGSMALVNKAWGDIDYNAILKSNFLRFSFFAGSLKCLCSTSICLTEYFGSIYWR